MGESKLKRIRAEETLQSCAGVQTPAGKVQVRWESTSAATPMGQLAYAASFRVHLAQLLLDQQARIHLAESAWRLGQEQFTPSTCFQSLLERIRQ